MKTSLHKHNMSLSHFNIISLFSLSFTGKLPSTPAACPVPEQHWPDSCRNVQKKQQHCKGTAMFNRIGILNRDTGDQLKKGIFFYILLLIATLLHCPHQYKRHMLIIALTLSLIINWLTRHHEGCVVVSSPQWLVTLWICT